jgi:hypothetical protein
MLVKLFIMANFANIRTSPINNPFLYLYSLHLHPRMAWTFRGWGWGRGSYQTRRSLPHFSQQGSVWRNNSGDRTDLHPSQYIRWQRIRRSDKISGGGYFQTAGKSQYHSSRWKLPVIVKSQVEAGLIQLFILQSCLINLQVKYKYL